MIDFFITYQPLINQIIIASLLALGMFIWFRSGVFSFATSGLMAVGGYASAIASVTYHLPFWISVLVALVTAAVLALVLGVTVLRLHRIHFALATLAFSELIRLLMLNWEGVTHGAIGISGIPQVARLWQLILSLVIVAYATARLSGNTKYGRALAVMREDHLLAGTLGIYVNWYRVLFFVIGSVPTALAGVYQAHFNMYISPDQFGFHLITSVLMMNVLGGMSNWIGPILGAIVVTFLPEALRMSQQYLMFLNGLILLAVAIFLPKGLIGVKFRSWKKSVTDQPSTLNLKIAEESAVTAAHDDLSIFSPDKYSVANITPLLELEAINVHFGGLQVLSNVAFSVREGEVFGLIGPNGAGKTTLINVISGVVTPSAGRLLWGGKDVTRLRPDQLSRIGISRTYQNIRLQKEMTVFENVLLGTHKGLHYGLAATLFISRRTREEEREARSETWNMLKRLGLEGYASIPASSLAYGLQRRVEVARALVSRPRLLLLDEPTSGMNEAETAEFGELITDLRAAGETIMLVEHHIPLVAQTCNRVLVLNFGVPIASGTPVEIQAIPEVIEAYLGIDYAVKEVVQ